MKIISIILVNYNTCQLTSQCIESIFNSTKGVDFEVILVDNASIDGSRAVFEKDDRIKYIYSDTNLGFGRACNLGFENSVGDYIFFLNTDTIVTNNVIYEIKNKTEELQQQGVKVGTTGILLTDNQGKINNSFWLFPDGFCKQLTMLCDSVISRVFPSLSITQRRIKAAKKNGFAEVDFIIGADMFVPRVVIDELGAFDSDFFMYCEEVEWQKRMEKSGYKRILLDVQGIKHLESGSFEKKISFKRYKMMRNSNVLYARKHLKGLHLIGYKLIMPIVHIKEYIAYNHAFSEDEKKLVIKNILSLTI